MKTVKYILLATIASCLLALFACDDSGSGDDPLPNPLRFTVQTASFEGNAISPLPNYTLSINYDDNGTITGYSATGSGQFTPSPANSGTVAVSGNTATFTSGIEIRSVTITGGSLSQTSTTVTLQFSLTKVDDGIAPEEEGTYVFVMTTE